MNTPDSFTNALDALHGDMAAANILADVILLLLPSLHLVLKPGGSPEAANWRSGGYIERLPKDPWSRDYQYVAPGSHGDFDVYSLGKDGQSGGEGIAADIGNWTE